MIQELGKKVRELRVRKGIGLNEFAKELSVSPREERDNIYQKSNLEIITKTV